MTKEDQNLLKIDLCARLPYNVKGNYLNSDGSLSDDPLLSNIIIQYHHLTTVNGIGMVLDGSIKPYLLPLSSMSEEQKSYLHFNTKFRIDRFEDLVVKIDEDDNYFYTDIYDYISLIDWLLKNHFDFRGLIPKGLAIDATNLNIY